MSAFHAATRKGGSPISRGCRMAGRTLGHEDPVIKFLGKYSPATWC